MNTTAAWIAAAIGLLLVIIAGIYLLFWIPTPSSTGSTGSPQASSGQATPPPTATTTPLLVVTRLSPEFTQTLKPFQKFVLELGDYNWTLTFTPTGFVTRVGDSTIAGSQGIFQATKVGTTVLEAVGRPFCNPGEMCAQFLIEQKITFVVTAN